MSEVRITDTMAGTRGFNEFRHLDQQERALAERMAAHVSEKETHEAKKDVEEMDRSVADRSDEHQGAGGHHHGRSAREREETPAEAPPEVSEGHLLDLKA